MVYGKGRDRLVEIMLKQISRLRNAGYGVFIIAHTKFKEKTDVMTGEKYEQLTNNLRSDIYSSVANITQMIVTATLERQIVEGKQVGEKRYLYFRSNGLTKASPLCW